MPYEQLVPYYEQRLQVTPGITGLAQVSGLRGPTTDAVLATARIDHDLRYIAEWSLWLDLRIIIKTIWLETTRGTGH